MDPHTGTTRYRVLASSTEHEIEIKRSRFLCLVTRAASEEEARLVIGERRRQFHDARHTCSAFVLGPGREISRSSDDGEPAGTAGAPMLDALTRFHSEDPLSDVVAVVTRWFGGILLGAGGLTRAYSQAVAETLQRSRFVTRELQRTYHVDLDHAVAGRAESAIRATGLIVTEVEHAGTGVRLSLAAPVASGAEAIASRIDEATSGSGRLSVGEVAWIDLTDRP